MVSPALLPVYRRSPFRMVRGEGVYLFDESGKRYLDFAAGIAVNALGHCHPHLVEALKTQGETLWHCANLYEIPQQEKLAERLVAASFADKVFFCNSGAEAVEAGIKFARRYHYASGHPEKYKVIAVEGAFHGRTLATIAAGGKAKYLEGFGPVVEGFDHVPFNNLNALRAAVTPQTAAILLEPIQGEGGVRAFGLAYLQEARKIADEFGILLFLDEVQCGMGRTGKLFSFEHAGIKPDIVAVAKGIGNGFPLGACLMTDPVASALAPGTHGSTYGGNPLAMAVGNAVLDIVLADGFMDQVVATGTALKNALQGCVDSHPKLLDSVRGVGMILGLVTKIPAADLVGKLRLAGLLTVAAGDDVIRILPPLTMKQAEIDEGIAILKNVLGSWQ